jgi:hypothetical protein
MHRAVAIALAALVGLLAGACRSSIERADVGSQGHLIAEVRTADGRAQSYRVHPGLEGPPKIHRTETAELEVARLGISVVSLKSALAQELGLPAWRGTLVESVDAGSAADQSGLVPGDLVLSIAGVEVTSQEQFVELVHEGLEPRKEVEVRYLRPGTNGFDTESLLLTRLTPEGRQITESRSDSFTLETSRAVQTLTGLQVAGVPADLAREIWGAEQGGVVVVAGVVSGSPAYRAGLRGGDRIVSVEGRPITTVQEVREALHSRARGMPLDADEELFAEHAPESAEPDPSGVEGEALFAVDGPLGPHSARVELVEDLYRSSTFNVPVLFDYSANTDTRRWSFLDFILQFGASYRHAYLRSPTREPATESYLSFLPFGMFEFERGPAYRRSRLFWVINWESRR